MSKVLKDPSRSIQIVPGLEPDYKPRYKSDYFSRHRKIRKS